VSEGATIIVKRGSIFVFIRLGKEKTKQKKVFIYSPFILIQAQSTSFLTEVYYCKKWKIIINENIYY
jgi:hypothetical protein